VVAAQWGCGGGGGFVVAVPGRGDMGTLVQCTTIVDPTLHTVPRPKMVLANGTVVNECEDFPVGEITIDASGNATELAFEGPCCITVVTHACISNDGADADLAFDWRTFGVSGSVQLAAAQACKYATYAGMNQFLGQEGPPDGDDDAAVIGAYQVGLASDDAYFAMDTSIWPNVVGVGAQLLAQHSEIPPGQRGALATQALRVAPRDCTIKTPFWPPSAADTEWGGRNPPVASLDASVSLVKIGQNDFPQLNNCNPTETH
jgi:hypothetical protein